MKIQHVACPKCRQLGKDTAGDNLACYPDGGAFCFSCGYYVGTRKFVPKELAEAKPHSFQRSIIPKGKRAELEQYLTHQEIQDHFCFDPKLGRMVLLDTLPDFYWGRDGHNGRSKVFTQGKVPFHVFSSKSSLGKDILVVVEDPVSAIVVSRVANCLPLFGSHLPHTWYRNLLLSVKGPLIFWLDRDKGNESLRLALTFRHLATTNYLVTNKDPKFYTPDEMEQYLGEAIERFDSIPL